MTLIGKENVFKIHFLKNEQVTSQHQGLTSQHEDLTRRYEDLTSGGRNI